MSSKATISKPMTPVVEAISKLPITGNVTPHIWYQRKEFRTAANRPDRDMITTLADIIYWYRPREVRDEDNGGIFVGYERKFSRDQLQYDYGRRAAIFGMTKRQMQEACGRLAKAGLVKIEYRTEVHKGKALSNIVYIEPVPEAIAATLTSPNVDVVERTKGAPRGMHARKADVQTPAYNPDAGVDDQTPGEGEQVGQGEQQAQAAGDEPGETPGQSQEGVSQNSGGGGQEGVSQNSGTPLPQKSGGEPPKNWDTYHESSFDISSSREFIHSSSPEGGSEGLAPGMDEQGEGFARTDEGTPGQAALEGSEALPLTGNGRAQVGGTKLNPVADLGDVPAAAGGSAILALKGIPMAELLARPERDPYGQREQNKVLRALMSATNASRDGHLQTQLGALTPSGLSRQLFRRLTDQELELARTAAQEDKALVKGGFPNGIYFALERLIGEPVTLSRLTGKGTEAKSEAPLGRAYQVTGAGAAVQSAPAQPDADEPVNGDFQPGALWKQKKGSEFVRIEERTPAGLKLDNGKTVSVLDLSRLYQLVAPAPARVAS